MYWWYPGNGHYSADSHQRQQILQLTTQNIENLQKEKQQVTLGPFQQCAFKSIRLKQVVIRRISSFQDLSAHN